MEIRKYKTADCTEIAELFFETVHTINAKDYTKSQLDVWANGKIDIVAWGKSFLEHNTLVAEENNIIVGLVIWIITAILTGYLFTKTIKVRVLPHQL